MIIRCFLLSSPDAIATNIPLTMPKLLTDPFLQLPTTNSVNVVWFTEFPGDRHWVLVGDKLAVSYTHLTLPTKRIV